MNMGLSAELIDEIDATVNKVMQTWNVPGLALAIVKDDQVILSKGYGVREMGQPEKVDEHTLFAIGSNTKAFTATAVGLLVQEGKLAWDDPVTKYIPSFQLHNSHAAQLMTIRDLLCHRGGLGTWTGDMLQFSSYSLEEIVRRLRYIPPAYSFRAGYGYCNLMFITAELVISTVSGMSWDEFVRQRIFEPSGMQDSVTSPFFFGDRINIATPHEDVKGKLQTVNYRKDNHFGAAGAICSSISDIATWMRLQLNLGTLDGKRFVDEAIVEETHTPHTIMPLTPVEKKFFPSRRFSAYGLGWFLNETDGRFVVRHTGGVDGMLSNVMMIPDRKIGIAVFSNKLPNAAYVAIPHYLTEKFLGLPERNWIQMYVELDDENKKKVHEAQKIKDASRAKDTHPSFDLEKYAGAYESDILGGATLSLEGDALHIQLQAHTSISGTLEHWHYDTFECHWDDPVLGESLMPFLSDGQGNVTGFCVKFREDWIDPLEHVFRKK
jgi:CubicO group peptidase (beta-lactamase class C family)